MNNRKFSVRAFTLMEVTIALLLSAICLALSYYVFSMFSMMMTELYAMKTSRYQFHRFYVQLQKDAEYADEMLFDNNVLALNSVASQVKYIISDSLILRNQDNLITDSFSYKTHEIQNFPLDNDEFNRMTAFIIRVEVVNKILPVIVEKNYSARQLLDH